MMRRRQGIVVAATCLLSVAMSGRAADLDGSVRSAPKVDNPADLEKYVADQIARVAAGDTKSTSARDELCRQVEPGSVTPSGEFKSAYVSAVQSNIGKLLDVNKSPAMRLNAGIIVARITAATRSPILEREIVTLLNDPSPAVSLWGMKAVRSVLPDVLGSKIALTKQKLTAAVVESIKKHPGTGVLVQDAYATLDVSGIAGSILPEGVQAATDAILSLVEFRTSLYLKGTPPAVLAERDPMNYFGKDAVFSKLTPAEKLRVVQALCDLMGVASARFAENGGELRDNLADIASNSASALIVQMTLSKDESAKPFLSKLRDLRNLAQTQVSPTALTAISSIQKIAQFSQIKNPPVVEAPPTAAGN